MKLPIKQFFQLSGFILLGTTCLQSHAALLNGSTLNIDSSSYFNLYTTENFPIGPVSITGVDGIVLGTAQPFPASAGSPSIDSFNFLAAPGSHYTTSTVDILSSSGNMASLDFSGWSFGFNGFEIMSLGSGSWSTNPDGVAEIVCGLDCSNGDSYTLYYSATAPSSNASGYENYTYELSLTGTISSVPVPAAAWLFVSGLLGLLGFSNRNKHC